MDVVPLGADADETFWGLECHCLGEGIAGVAPEEQGEQGDLAPAPGLGRGN